MFRLLGKTMIWTAAISLSILAVTVLGDILPPISAERNGTESLVLRIGERTYAFDLSGLAQIKENADTVFSELQDKLPLWISQAGENLTKAYGRWKEEADFDFSLSDLIKSKIPDSFKPNLAQIAFTNAVKYGMIPT